MVLVILYALVFLATTNNMVIVTLLPKISAELVMDIQEIGYLTGIYGLMSALCTFIFGPISDKIGRKKMLENAAFIFGGSILLCAFAWNYESLFCFRLISGIASAPIVASAYSYLGDYYPKERIGYLFGILSSAMFLGSILGIPLANYCAYYWNWKISFVILGCGMILMGLWLSISMEAIKTGLEKERLCIKNIVQKYGVLLKERRVYWVLIMIFILYVIVYVPNSFISLWFAQVFHMNLKEIGHVFLAAGIFSFFGSLITGKLLRYFSLFMILLGGIGISVLASILFSWGAGSFFSILLFSLLSFGGAVRLVCLQTLSNAVSAHQRGSMSALFTGTGLAGGTIGPVLGGTFLQKTNFKATGEGFIDLMLYCALAFLLSTLAWIKLKKAYRAG